MSKKRSYEKSVQKDKTTWDYARRGNGKSVRIEETMPEEVSGKRSDNTRRNQCTIRGHVRRGKRVDKRSRDKRWECKNRKDHMRGREPRRIEKMMWEEHTKVDDITREERARKDRRDPLRRQKFTRIEIVRRGKQKVKRSYEERVCVDKRNYMRRGNGRIEKITWEEQSLRE